MRDFFDVWVLSRQFDFEGGITVAFPGDVRCFRLISSTVFSNAATNRAARAAENPEAASDQIDSKR